MFYGNVRAKIDAACDYVFSGKGGSRAFFGNQVRAGDVNDDGYSDALIAAPEVNDGVGKVYLYYGPLSRVTNTTFNWDTTNASIGKHTLKVEIPPVPGEQNTENNVKTLTIEVKESLR